jgi:glycosyltransferase involved in cell wall biosynthesis
MNICMLSSDFLPNVGGITAHLVGLSRALVKLGHRVDVVRPEVSPHWLSDSEELLEGVHIHRFRVAGIPRLTERTPHFVNAICRRLVALERTRHYDIFHWHTLGGDAQVAARCHMRAKVFTNHSSYYLRMMATKQGQRKAKTIVAPAGRVIAPSQELADATVTAGYDERCVDTIPNGVDTERYSPGGDPTPVRERYGIPKDALVFLCARRLEIKNGVRYWAQALPHIIRRVDQRVHFLFVGDHPHRSRSDREPVLEAIGQLPDPSLATFAGSIPNSDMTAYLAASDVAVLPSLIEATSIAGLEAMACGLPLIGTNVGGIPEILSHDETGLLVPAASPEALASAAVSLSERDSVRISMGRRARERVLARFSWETIAQQTLQVYEQCRSQDSLDT